MKTMKLARVAAEISQKVKLSRKIAAVLLLSSMAFLGEAQEAKPVGKAAPETPPQPVAKSDSIETELGAKLATVRRIYVDSFGDDLMSKQMQAMIVASLSESKRFIITENKDRADAVLRGSGLEKTSQEIHSYNESTAAGHVSGTATRDFASVGGAAAAIDDASTNTETVDHARLAVRLVDRDGDVIWSNTQESKGAKYKGASADVAEKVVKQLLRDLDREDKKRLVQTDAK